MRNKEAARKANKKWRESHKEQCRLRGIKYRDMLKETILSHYGNGKVACVLCGYSNPKALSIDHINNGGKQHRTNLNYLHGIGFYLWLRRNNYPDGYQTLCMNCQWEKR